MKVEMSTGRSRSRGGNGGGGYGGPPPRRYGGGRRYANYSPNLAIFNLTGGILNISSDGHKFIALISLKLKPKLKDRV